MAAPLPEIAAARAWEALVDVRARQPLVRWLPPNKLHLTLVFLGSTDRARVAEISTSVERVAQAHKAFDVATGEAGSRVGSHRGGVAWLGIVDGGHEVAQLSFDTDDAIGAHTFDFSRAPRPHLTVARGVSEAGLADLRRAADTIRLTWTVDRIVLFRSHTDAGGSRYEELVSAELASHS